MAPKKKKKAHGNPARGFSTVSVPSKPKRDVSSDSEAPAAGPDDDPAPVPVPETATLNKDLEQTDIRDMLPDELEIYLETAELEALLKSNSTRCKSEATRQITKLKTETSQLRPQSVQLSTFSWLDDHTVEQILSIYDQDLFPPPATASLLQHGDHKLLLDLWILQQVLSSLGFPEPNKALAHLLQLAFTYTIRSDGGYIWGLSETWDWYALNFPLKELPEYQTFTVPQPTVVQDLPLAQSDYRPGKPHCLCFLLQLSILRLETDAMQR
jgi:ATP-dependent RNA helicase DHX29